MLPGNRLVVRNRGNPPELPPPAHAVPAGKGREGPGRAGKGQEGPGRAGKGLPPPRPGGSGAFGFRGFTEGEAERGQGSWVDASGLVFEARAR